MLKAGTYAVIPITLIFVAILLWVADQSKPSAPQLEAPDFSSFTDVKAKKSAFFNYMLPMVRQANDEIRREKNQLANLMADWQKSSTLSGRHQKLLEKLAVKYRVTEEGLTDLQIIEELQRRIDTVPASLALAQAANESAWGTARFARNGKNYFGLWCWSPSCGLVPTERDEGKTHEVARFSQPVDGVRYYMLTLNSHPAYGKLRQLRWQARQQDQQPTGRTMAEGLLNYSERREEYINELKAMIRINQLQQFNRKPTVDQA